MKVVEENKISKNLVCRNGLSEKEVKTRLLVYFSEQDVNDIIHSCRGVTSWTDGHIVVICTDKSEHIYSIVTSNIYAELIQP